MKKLHNKLVRAWIPVGGTVTEYNGTEYKYPESLIRATDRDWNTEVIYLDDVILLQENGMKSKNRRAFVYTTANWEHKAAQIILNWLLG